MALKKELTNCRLLKNSGSWLYCKQCEKTVGYLCYSTYQRFSYNFTCACGAQGSILMEYPAEEGAGNSNQELELIKNRYCCPNDASPLFTIVNKHVTHTSYEVTCNKCHTSFLGDT